MKAKNRKLSSDGHHWLINTAWIKQQIAKTYKGYVANNDLERTLHIHKLHSSGDLNKFGAILFELGGTPPKGYALYIPDHKKLVIIDAWGEKITKYKDTIWVEDSKL